jgi:hypothetical protein
MKCSILIIALAVLGSAGAGAQDRRLEEVEYDEASPMGVAIGVRGGMVMTTPRGSFPSIIIGGSAEGTGALPQVYAETGQGSRFDATLMIPFSPSIGLSAAFGTLHYSAKYRGDSARVPTQFEVQTLQAAAGLQWSVINDRKSYRQGGLRSVYFDGGVDVSVLHVANRIDATSYADSTKSAASKGTGSFANSDPFRALVALRGGLGIRFAPEPNLELIAETSYSYALNSVFSSLVIDDNDFTIDNLIVQVGIGYRF